MGLAPDSTYEGATQVVVHCGFVVLQAFEVVGHQQVLSLGRLERSTGLLLLLSALRQFLV
jgi:hypothetical protein